MQWLLETQYRKGGREMKVWFISICVYDTTESYKLKYI